MKQAATTIRDALRSGLRQYSNNPRGVPGLVECHNLAPAEQGLEPHEEITNLGDDSVSWGGEGSYTPSAVTRTITIRVTDYVDASELQTVTVFLDSVDKGTTDAAGELDIANVTVGGHELKLTKAGYVDSDLDDLFNDYIFVI
jgi:hypothetical protein